MSALVVNLDKLSEGIAINLEKRVTNASEFPSDINVTLALDVSGSMTDAFTNGAVLHVLQRVVAVSNVIDDDGVLNFFCFSEKSLPQADIVAAEDFDKLQSITKKLANNSGYDYWNGTCFQPVLKDIVDGHLSPDTVAPRPERVASKPGFMSKLKGFFSSKPADVAATAVASQAETSAPEEIKQLVILITDGDNFDKTDTERFFNKMKNDNRFYFQCIGVNCSNSFLRNSAEKYGNVGYTEITYTQDDESLANALVSDQVLRHFGY